MARTIILSACFLTGCFLCGCQAAAPASPPNMFEPSSSLLPPLATTTPTAKRPAEPQPTLTPRKAPVEFFVDGSSPAASDANPGSAEKPFKTINRGLKELRPGDALTVQGGTYREAFRVKIVASAEHPVVLRAAPGQTVVIKGSELVKGWVKDGNVWKKEGWTQEYVQKTFDKGEGASADPMAVYQKDGVHGEGVVLFRVVRRRSFAPASAIGTRRPERSRSIRPGTEPFDPNQDGVEVPVRGFGMSIEGRYVNASGFQIRQITSGNGIGGWHNRIEDCVYTWSGNCGTYVGGFYTTVRRCETSYCGCTGMGGCGRGNPHRGLRGDAQQHLAVQSRMARRRGQVHPRVQPFGDPRLSVLERITAPASGSTAPAWTTSSRTTTATTTRAAESASRFPATTSCGTTSATSTAPPCRAWTSCRTEPRRHFARQVPAALRQEARQRGNGNRHLLLALLQGVQQPLLRKPGRGNRRGGRPPRHR